MPGIIRHPTQVLSEQMPERRISTSVRVREKGLKAPEGMGQEFGHPALRGDGDRGF